MATIPLCRTPLIPLYLMTRYSWPRGYAALAKKSRILQRVCDDRAAVIADFDRTSKAQPGDRNAARRFWSFPQRKSGRLTLNLGRDADEQVGTFKALQSRLQ